MARKIVERAADHGVPREDVVIDPIIMPIGAVESAGTPAFRLVWQREELGVDTCCGASNISFGLPHLRSECDVSAMAIARRMTSAITNAIEAEIKHMILAADVMMGHDPNCRTWIRTHRPGQRERGRRER